MGNPIYILAGQSNATAMRHEFEAALKAANSTNTYYAKTIATAGAPLTWQRSLDDWMNESELPAELYDTIKTILTSDPDAYVAGIIWIQGEADTYSIARADEYKQALNNMIQDIRDSLEQDFPNRDTNHDEFDVVISGLSTNAPEAPNRANWDTIRHEQFTLAHSDINIQRVDPDTIAYLNNIQTTDMFHDGLHYSTLFQDVLMNALVQDLMVDGPSNIRSGHCGNDDFIGTNGVDIFLGGSGRDVFIFRDDDSRWGERVMGFEDGIDHIKIDTITPQNFDDLHIYEHATLDGAVVNYGSGSFILMGIDVADVTQDDFIFA